MNLQDFVGQKKLIERLLAVVRNSDGWNILLRGHYGFGKTALAMIIAGMFGIYTCQVPHAGKIVIPKRDNIQVVDECHLVKNFESLYEIMGSRNFLFCTNMGSRLPEPFISRCRVYRLGAYTIGELARIISFHAKTMGTTLDAHVCRFMANRSRGNPRTAVENMKEYLYLCKERKEPCNMDTVVAAFSWFGIDDAGLTEIDRSYLTAVATCPKSRNTLQAMLCLDQLELERVESYLIRQGLVHITSRGRLAT